MGRVPYGTGHHTDRRGNRLLHMSDREFRDASKVANLRIENGGLYMTPKHLNGVGGLGK